mgnify:FL=1
MDDFREIVEACISGDHRASERLYRRLAPQMFGVCLRYAKDKEEAEDNLHDGFMTVFTKLKDFRHEGSFEGWVRRIMVNICINRYRQKQQLVLVDEERKLDSALGEEVTLGNIPMEELVKVIQELPPRYRMVFNLYVMEGYSHTDISQELGITEGASRSNLSRARDILRAKLEKQYSEFLANRREEI